MEEPTGMTDRALLESLGYKLERRRQEYAGQIAYQSYIAGPNGGTVATDVLDSGAEWEIAGEALLGHEWSWILLDDALAARGWITQLYHRPTGFFYHANKNGAGVSCEPDQPNRISATRQVYEQVLSLNNKEIEG